MRMRTIVVAVASSLATMVFLTRCSVPPASAGDASDASVRFIEGTCDKFAVLTAHAGGYSGSWYALVPAEQIGDKPVRSMSAVTCSDTDGEPGRAKPIGDQTPAYHWQKPGMRCGTALSVEVGTAGVTIECDGSTVEPGTGAPVGPRSLRRRFTLRVE